MRLIDADRLLEGIEELKQSPWFNNKYGYADRKEAVESIEYLCIKKEPTIDAVEQIEYEKMKDLAEQYKFEYECLFEDYKDIINNVLPNRVEVVRCKDCKHYCPVYADTMGGRDCLRLKTITKADDFCSYGDRKEEE